MRIRYGILLILAVISLASAPYMQTAFAQSSTEPAGFKNVTLWINPEYDDPRLLVMLEGKIVGIAAPTQVRFLVPEAAEMYSAGSKDAQGKYSGGPPGRVPSQIPGWDEISYILKTDTFRVEYYDPIIAGQPDKKISYDFRWLYPLSDLRVVVQEPKKSSNFSVAPNGGTTTDPEGFAVHTYSYRNLMTADKPLHFDIGYTKSDPNKSGLILGLVVGIVLAGALVWFLRPERKLAYSAKPAAGSGQIRLNKRKGAGKRFCGQCGQPLDGPSKFCPHCGNKPG